jgi:hypothetical protein
MVHGSWFMVHGSWCMVHGSWLMGSARLVGCLPDGVSLRVPSLRSGGYSCNNWHEKYYLHNGRLLEMHPCPLSCAFLPGPTPCASFPGHKKTFAMPSVTHARDSWARLAREAVAGTWQACPWFGCGGCMKIPSCWRLSRCTSSMPLAVPESKLPLTQGPRGGEGLVGGRVEIHTRERKLQPCLQGHAANG